MAVALFEKGSVRGFLHEPKELNGRGLVLTHGAGGNCQSPLLVNVSRVFAECGWCVLRFDLPFRQRKAYGPPTRASAAEDRKALKEAAEYLRSRIAGRISLGGHSYGGRQASMLMAGEPQVGDGLLLLSYPLHPPKEPQSLRTGHFPLLRNPVLFVHGAKDPFGSIEELRMAAAAIPAATEIVAIQNAGHDLLQGVFAIEKLVAGPLERLLGPASVS